MAWKNQSNFQRNNITTNFPDFTLNNVIIKSDLSNLDVSNVLVVHGDLSCNNYYVNNDITTNNIYVTNDISVNNLHVVNDISTNNLHVVNDLSTNNDLYVTNDISTNNIYVTYDISTNNNLYVDNDTTITNKLHVVNDLSANNLYVTNDLSTNNLNVVENTIMNNLDNTNTNFLYYISDLSINDLIINNDISFNTDKISIYSEENGVTNTRKLEITNDGEFYVLNEDNNKIYDFTSGFIIKPFTGSLSVSPNSTWTLYSAANITFDKIAGKNLNITFLSDVSVTGSGNDTFSSRLKVYNLEILIGQSIEPIMLLRETIDWGEIYHIFGSSARQSLTLNNLNAVTTNTNIRNGTHISLEVEFQSQGDDTLNINNGQWLITSF